MELDHIHKAQLGFAFMYWEPATKECRGAVRTQAEVAHLMGISQTQVNRLETSALSKLRRMPEVKRLMRDVSQHYARNRCIAFQPLAMRRVGSIPSDVSSVTAAIYREEY